VLASLIVLVLVALGAGWWLAPRLARARAVVRLADRELDVAEEPPADPHGPPL
jgi:hypothetical protein